MRFGDGGGGGGGDKSDLDSANLCSERPRSCLQSTESANKGRMTNDDLLLLPEQLQHSALVLKNHQSPSIQTSSLHFPWQLSSSNSAYP
ncbi:hypothetical protein PGT21_021147 [Puccinia graminis f. sp. tritici]|uniref:Uncharacterized protein n=1 Tax=Puccinia graminis f. sp. tritici TaxID=56615 RepID=A0A5B0MDV1_PUCGR|nr:hypothetical protein PGT21_021147 [Puccinia graminis f. sp. tritici]